MSQNYLVMLRAFHGKSEPILEQARKAGAKGGTVIHSRLTVASPRHFFPSLDISEEEELVMIFANAETAKAICKSLLECQTEGKELGSRIYLIPVASVHGLVNHTLTDI